MKGINIATAGLTAAGKTTHGKLLAAALGYSYVSATELFLHHLGMAGESPEGLWFRRYSEIETARKGDELDDAIESDLKDMAVQRSRTVFDTWALPWLSDAPMIRIWLESDAASRTRKAFVSQENVPNLVPLSLEECRAHLAEKDESTRDRFWRRHGFDLYSDRAEFDLILNNSSLIPEATMECARLGIRSFGLIVLHAVLHLITDGRSHLDLLNTLDPHGEHYAFVGGGEGGRL